MNKKFIKLLCLIFIFFLGTNVYALDNSVNSKHHYYKELNGNKLVIEDDANLLDDKEVESLAKNMEKLTKYGHIAFKTTSSNGISTKDFAKSYYHDTFGTSSGSVFVIDMNNRYIYIFSDGMNYNYINKNKALTITDNVYRYATKGEYYKCASLAFNQMDIVLSKGHISQPMRYISGFIVALILSCFICYIKVYIDSNNYVVSNDDILKKCDIQYNVKSVTSKRNGQEAEYSPVDSGDSFGGYDGGGSGGGGFGGGSSGGGGGHGF